MREKKKKYARTLRKRQTDAEKIVWSHLKDRRFNGLKFRRQFVIEGFIVDFFCPELSLVLEIDGPVHFKHREYDEAREDIIRSEGFHIIRFRNDEISPYRKDFYNILSKALDRLS